MIQESERKRSSFFFISLNLKLVPLSLQWLLINLINYDKCLRERNQERYKRHMEITYFDVVVVVVIIINAKLT